VKRAGRISRGSKGKRRSVW